MAALKPRNTAAPLPSTKAVKAAKLPKTLAGCADRYYLVREERLAAQKQVDALQAEESALKERLIAELPKSEASGIAGRVARASVTSRPTYQAKDWDKIRAYVIKNQAFDLLQKRLNQEAVDERFAAKKKIPGIEIFNVVSLSCTKV